MAERAWFLPPGLVIVLSFLALAAPDALAEPEVRIGVSGETRAGDYGLDETTEEYRVTLDGSVAFDRLFVYASLPFVSVEGPAGAASASATPGLVTRPGLRDRFRRSGMSGETAGNQDQSADGLGDGLFGASLQLTSPQRPSQFSVFTDATLPTGDEEAGLGTGTTDISIGASAGYTFSATTINLTGGYTFTGDPDETDALLAKSDDYTFASLGISHAFSSGVIGGAGLSWAEAEDGEDPPLALFANASLPLGERVSLLGYGHAGLSEASADYGFGLGLSFSIGN